jgi:hypothetical protein
MGSPLHDDHAFAEQGQPVGDPERATHVVRHHDAGDTQLVVQPLHEAVDDIRVDRVQARGGLVVEEILGTAGDGPRDPHPLPHPAGELSRVLLDRVQRQVHQPDAFGDALPTVLQIVVLVLVGDAEPHVLEHIHRVEQGAVLKHVADLGAHLGEVLPPERRDVLPIHDHRSAVRLDQADDVLQQDALPGARRSEEGNGLALAHFEVDPLQDYLLAEGLMQRVDLDHWLSSSRVRTVSSTRMSTELVTTAAVVDRPTPSAPCWVLNPM